MDMEKNTERSKAHTENREGKRKGSIVWKLSFNLLVVLIPALVIMIAAACVVASQSISQLNNKLLDVQTDYAISIVDDFFKGKIAAVSMYQNDGMLIRYFNSVENVDDIEKYGEKQSLTDELSEVLERMSGENVMQVWVADKKTDNYLFSSGDTGKAGLADQEWYEMAMESREPIVSDPYQDVFSGEMVISVVAPVFSDEGADIIGFLGLDMAMDSLSELLTGIKVGENGYMELLSNCSVYIYSNDKTSVNRNVDELDITEDYKKKVRENYNGTYSFAYRGIDYTAIFRNSQTTKWLAIATLPVSEMNATRSHLILLMAVLSVLILLLLIIVIVAVLRRMMQPLAEISSQMEHFAKGRLDVDIEIKRDDEIGRLAGSIRRTICSLKDMISDVSYILGEISNGNLDVEMRGSYMGDFVHIKEALEQITTALNATLGQISSAAEQVSSGSSLVSDGAQSLAQGASEQAGTVEELASGIHEISEQITSNAANSENASKRASAVGREAVESNSRMQEMLTAMEDIRRSSQKIGDILKAIEDIAFQTNILALNASVEAARAGEAGRGFSVVAGEVRNLASKSAEAAKNTTELIHNSLNAVEHGTKIADDTAKSLQNVMRGAGEVAEALNEISKASSGQAHYVEQVTRGIEQISNVVQDNSATAEESAAASEELSAQAILLKDQIGKFHIKEN